MILSVTQLPPSLYRVEVSGWDAKEAFFVEKSDLEWDGESGKHVTLNRAVREGAIIFVRLLQPTSDDKSCPVAYEAETLRATPEGHQQIRLRPVSPRSRNHESPSK
jgi:hypothetical protein